MKNIPVPRSPIPKPPYSAQLLADLHAGALAPEISEQLWPLARRDPAAARILAELDEVSDLLRNIDRDRPAPPMPPDISARVEQTLAGIQEELRAPVSLSSHRFSRVSHLRSSSALFAAAAVAVTVLAGAAVMVGLRPHTIAPPAQAAPLELTDGLNSLPITTLIAAHRYTVSGPLSKSSALNSCLRAVGADHPRFGTMDVRLQGQDGVLILTASATPGKVTALVVEPNCSIDNPRVLARADF